MALFRHPLRGFRLLPTFSCLRSEAIRGGCDPNPVRTVSSIGKSAVTRFARMTQSHKGSNFFYPPAYATCLNRSLKPGFAQAPFQIELHL